MAQYKVMIVLIKIYSMGYAYLIWRNSCCNYFLYSVLTVYITKILCPHIL